MSMTVLITGASCGIGYEFAKIFAENGYDLVLVARSAEKLYKIKKDFEKQYNVLVTCCPKDLTASNAPKELFEKLFSDGIKIDYLINNAGFGDNHAYLDSPWDTHENMVKLNILALMELCYLFGKEMCDRQSGRILNVSSVAAFSGGPDMSVYYASKAFVLSFSEALAEEFRPKNVTVTCLCPGPTLTNFAETANSGQSNMFKLMRPSKPYDVAKTGYKAMIKGKTLSYCGANVKIMAFLTRFSPRSLNANFAKFMDRSENRH